MPTVSFQQGVNGYTGTADTMIQQATPTTAYGTSTKLSTDTGTNANVQTLLTFDGLFGTGPGQIPLGATITSATLTLQTTNGSAQGASLHRMLTNWTGVPTWTWDSFNNGIQFDGTEAVAAADVSTGAVIAGSRDLNVTNSLQAWSNGAANYGWAFKAGGTDGWDFYSAQGATKPKLTVTYELPTTGPPVVSIGTPRRQKARARLRSRCAWTRRPASPSPSTTPPLMTPPWLAATSPARAGRSLSRPG
jgi:hypothetical protein